MPSTRAAHPHPHPRRLRAAALVAAALAALSFAAPAAAGTGPADTADAAATTLNSLAAAKGRYIGSATDNGELSDSSYTSVLGSEFGSITPGNSMKWDTTEPTQGQFNFTRGDVIRDLAQQHNQLLRGHTLVWHSQLPGWVSSLPSSQVQAAMENHITKEAAHYKGQVYAWDVVNEPFNDNGTYRTDPFYNAMGSGYIADALRTARAADPAAKLYINDYNIDGSGAKADAMYALAKSLKQQGVPLDGIGFQGHLAIQYGFPGGMQANLQRFADLGLDVAFTELDVRMQLPADSAKLATQADYYKQVTQACLAVTRCVGITVWDYTDKYSWVPGTFPGEGAACLYDENLRTKPSYTAMATALGGGSTGGDTTPPSTPTGLTVTGTTGSTVSLSWTASTDNVGVTGYDVFRGSTQAGTSTGTTFTDTGLSATTAYTYTVKAHDAAGNASSASSPATGTTTSGGGDPGGAFAVRYKSNDSSATDNQIKPGLRVVNTGSSPLSLSQVKLRYYFTGESGASTYSTWCDYAAISCSNVTHKAVAMSSPKSGADHYLEVGFSSGTLAPGADTGEVQMRLNKSDWSNFSEADDYSRGTGTSYADAPKIPGYLGTALSWGTEP
jgi:endo-1,4-beta-xylanase